jgi:sRNA-binding carbon storage regulator CsrA
VIGEEVIGHVAILKVEGEKVRLGLTFPDHIKLVRCDAAGRDQRNQPSNEVE